MMFENNFFSLLVTFQSLMGDFIVDEEGINEVLTEIMNKYDLSQEITQLIKGVVGNKVFTKRMSLVESIQLVKECRRKNTGDNESVINDLKAKYLDG